MTQETGLPNSSNTPPVITHFSHPQHSLMLLDGCGYRCNGCGLISPGGIRYRCLPCNFDLHCTCAALPHSYPHLHYPAPPTVPGPLPPMPGYAGVDICPQYQNQGTSGGVAGSGCTHSHHHLHSPAPPLMPGPIPSMPVNYNTMPGYAGVNIHPQYPNQGTSSGAAGSGHRFGKRAAVKAFVNGLTKAVLVSLFVDDAENGTLLDGADDNILSCDGVDASFF